MARSNNNIPKTADKIFDDLDSYRDFCREFGHVFNERDLYAQRSYIYRQYLKHIAGKPVKNNWDQDSRPKYRKRN